MYVMEDKRPLYLLRFIGRPTADEFEAYKRDMLRIAGRRQPYALVYDCQKTKMPSTADIRDMVEWFEQYGDQLRPWRRCAALAMTSPVLRGALNFMNRVNRPISETRVFATMEEAEAWARAVLWGHASDHAMQ